MALSAKNKENLLQLQLVASYGLAVEKPKPKSLTVEEVFDDKFIYNIDGQLYEAGYEIDEDGNAVLGEGKKVTATKIFKSLESLREIYGEIIQEAGKRNAVKDASRIQTILKMCQELLDREEVEEPEVKEALKNAKSELKWCKTQESVKVVDGGMFPLSAFAYAPDANDPDTWQLLLHEGDAVSRAKLKEASAALSPGGNKGHKASIPDKHLAEVKRRIRNEYRALGVDDSEIPRWVKENEIRQYIDSFVPLTEAKIDKGRATVIVIKPGFNATSERYYPIEMLKRDYKVFEGQKMYADHPTDEEDAARPERSIKDWVATLKNVTVDEAGVVSGTAEIIETWMMTKLASLRDKAMLSEMGVSINAIGSATEDTIDGKKTMVIEKLVGARSVDFVTEPGAGGIVTMYESDRGRDVDLIELSGLREKRPDLVKAIEAEVKSELRQEVKKAMENETMIKEKDEQIIALTAERDALKEAAEKAAKDKAIAEAQATIKEAVDKAELPDVAKTDILERFKSAETADGIQEAIKKMTDLIGQLTESGKVTGIGDTKPSSEADVKAFRESLKRTFPEWTDAQLDVAVAGR